MIMIKKYIKKGLYLQKKTENYWQSDINYNSIIIEYQKLINLLNKTPTKFRAENSLK